MGTACFRMQSVSDFPQLTKCAIIPAVVCVAKARHFSAGETAPIVANYDVIEESGAVLYDIRANRTAIHARFLIPILASSGV